MQEDVGANVHKKLEWKERLARFAVSGQSVKEFCLWESVSAASFYRWRQLLESSEKHVVKGERFIEIGALDQRRIPDSAKLGMDDGEAKLDVRLELGHGLVLRIVRR